MILPVRAALAAGLAAAAAVCYAVATQTIVIGSAEGGWQYPYIRGLTLRPFGAALLASGLAAAVVAVARSASRRREWAVVLAWIVAATLSHGLIRSLTPASFERIFRSDGANSFYSVTQRFDARTVLADFDAVRAQSPLHAQSNMPGKLVLLYGLETLSTRTDVLPWMIVVLSNLGGALMYLFVRDVFDDRRVALYALVLYLFVPARVLFYPLMNTVTPVVALAFAWALARWLRTGATAYAVLLGLGVYVMVFFEPLPLVLGLLFAALISRALVLRQVSWTRLAPQILAGAGATAAAVGVMYLAFGFDTIHAFRQVGTHAVEFNASTNRPYSVWVRANLREFAFGAGPCQTVLFAAAVVHALRGPGSWRDRLTHPLAVVSLSLVAVVAALDLLGVNRGEVIRLWIFVACFVQIPAAYMCARFPSPIPLLLVVSVSALQTALATATIGFVVP